MIGKAVKALSYKAIDRGVRLPRIPQLASYAQLARTIDLIRLQNISLVLDVGANRGWYAYHLRRAGYRGEIISFEPLPSECEHIRALSKGDPRWTVQEFALGEEDGQKTFNLIAANDGATVLSSFLETQAPLGVRREQIEVNIRRLDTLLPTLVSDISDRQIFLKMDTQGYDLSVLNGFEQLAGSVALLQSEISVQPLYDGMPTYTESLEHYHGTGFKLADLFVVNRTSSGDILEYDCLMQRNG